VAKIDLGRTASGMRIVLDWVLRTFLHVLWLGATGVGKSTLVVRGMVQLIEQGEGVTLIDPDNDTAEELYAACVEARDTGRISEERFRDVIYLKPDMDSAVRIDPFRRPCSMSPKHEEAWLAARIGHVCRILCRQAQMIDMKETRRMGRVLKCVLWMCAVGPKYIGLSHTERVATFCGEGFNYYFRKAAPYLPVSIRVDCLRIMRLSPYKRDQETESTLNLLRNFFDGPLITQMLTPGPDVLDDREAVRGKKVVIWNLGMTEYLSEEQRDALCALALLNQYSACYFERVHRHICVEEAARVMGHEFSAILNGGRKRKICFHIVNQGVASLRNSRIDIANDVFQCGAVVSGGQPSPFEQDILAPFFTASRMNFSLVQRPMDRPSGHRVVTLPEQSYSRGLHVGQKRSQGAERSLIRKLEVSRGHGKSLGRQVSHEEAESEEVSHRRSTGTDTGVTSASHTGRKSGNEYTSSNLISGPSKNPIIENKLTNTYRESADTGTSEEKSHTEREAVEDGESHSRRRARRNGLSRERSEEYRRTEGEAEGETEKWLVGSERTEVFGSSFAMRNHLLPVHREEWYPAGMLYKPDEQVWMFRQILSLLRQREFLIFQRGEPTQVFLADEIPRAFADRPAWGRFQVQKALEEMRKLPFFFTPTESEVWTGEKGTKRSARSSNGIHPTKSTGSKPGSSAITRLLNDVDQNLKRENEGESGMSEASS
jgi:hypothetical protein